MSKSPYKIPYKSPKGLAIAEAAWTTAVRLQQFGFAEIASAVHINDKRASQLVHTWEADGRVRFIRGGENGRPRKIYEVVPQDELKTGPVIGDAIDQMWTTMRKFSSFSPVDLKAHCAAPVTIEEARSYCRTLLAATYLRVIAKAVPGAKEAVYRLTNATGPRAPRKKRVVCIIDDNLGTTIPLTEDGQ